MKHISCDYPNLTKVIPSTSVLGMDMCSSFNEPLAICHTFILHVYIAVFMLGCFVAIMAIWVVIYGPSLGPSGFHENVVMVSNTRLSSNSVSVVRISSLPTHVFLLQKHLWEVWMETVNYKATVFENEICLDSEVSMFVIFTPFILT